MNTERIIIKYYSSITCVGTKDVHVDPSVSSIFQHRASGTGSSTGNYDELVLQVAAMEGRDTRCTVCKVDFPYPRERHYNFHTTRVKLIRRGLYKLLFLLDH